MDQDLVVMYGAQKDILANPVFKRLDAVEEDRVIYLDLTDQFAGALGFASALSLPYLVGEAEESLTNAVDGDPATTVTQPDQDRSARPSDSAAVRRAGTIASGVDRERRSTASASAASTVPSRRVTGAATPSTPRLDSSRLNAMPRSRIPRSRCATVRAR